MIFFDTTKAAGAGHRSGLLRVSTRLLEELGPGATRVGWPPTAGGGFQPADWYLTAELFSEAERPGFTAWLEARTVRTAAIFHDAIPLKHPHITWPQSVARHPAYMKLLAKFDRVWAVSRASQQELEGFWQWQGLRRPPPVDVLTLGANFGRAARITGRVPPPGRPRLLCVGILEPRKNQPFLVDACARLWREGLDFELHLVGRVNPHFGAPVLRAIRQAARAHEGRVVFHAAADDALLARLYAAAHASVLPTRAEGCGLPLLESLWMGVPCVCSDLPVLRENADGGGCLPVTPGDPDAWTATLRQVLTDRELIARLGREAQTRALPAWADAAAFIRQALPA